MQRYCFFITLQIFPPLFSNKNAFFSFLPLKKQKRDRFHPLFFIHITKPSIFVLCFSQKEQTFFQLTIKQRMNQTKLLVKKITEGIQEKKGQKIVVADLTEIDDTICNYFIICQGNSPSQVSVITDSVWDTVHEATGEKPSAIDGVRNAQWVAMDYSDVLVHIFLPEVREFYNLENLWADAKLTFIPDID
jgi:ribosome-associated protein